MPNHTFDSPYICETSSFSTITQKCSTDDCQRPHHKNGYFIIFIGFSVCKHHLAKAVRNTLRREIKNTYRGPDKAYASLDFSGKGYITEKDFLGSLIMKRIPYDREDVKEYFKQFNLFQGQGIIFDTFKKTFFPQLCNENEEQDSEEERKLKRSQVDLRRNKQKQP